MSKFATAGTHPPPGTLIDNDTLELVELVGSGGYGVVYRALETTAKPGRKPRTFAVKVLSRTDGRRNAHIREASLHYHVSGHPHVIDLYQVLEDDNYMYFVMQYARSKDLFHQILNNSYYLGNDSTIKIVFLQLLDAVDHLHEMGVFHRDLKPENILCLDDGYRIAISDFGLATTDKSSIEFRTGSIYHMSPECQSGRYAEDAYSPMSNDVWSLGIVLLNMVTGRNPWKSATTDDPVFQSYCRSPFNFFCSVLPVSSAFNKVLVQVLDPNWKTRMTLQRFRQEIQKIDTFYSTQVLFEGSLARCPWEADGGKKEDKGERKPAVKRRPVPAAPAGVKPFAEKERDAPPPIPQSGKPAQPEADAARHRAPPPPPPPQARVIKPPQRRPVPQAADKAERFTPKVDSLLETSMENVSLGDEDSDSHSSNIEVPHTPYNSHPSSMSSGSSFPKTPDNADFMGRGKNKVDVKIMASTHVSPVTSFSGQTHASSLLDDFSTYIDLSFSNDVKIPDQTMLSPAPSQYSLHEAVDYSMWSNSKETLAHHRRHGLSDDSQPEFVLYPETHSPSPSKPINIASNRQHQHAPSRPNMFDHPYYQSPSNSPHHHHQQQHIRRPSNYSSRPSSRQQQHHGGYPPQGRVAAMRKVWEKKLPVKPVPCFAGGTAYYGPPRTGRYWISSKAT